MYLLSLLQLFRMQPDGNILLRTLCPGRDSVVDIATRYGLGCPRIEFRWQRDLPHPSRSALGSVQPPEVWVPDLLPGLKWVGHVFETTNLAEVKEKVELYLSYAPGPSLPAIV
jgi:hypothetical protein